MAASSRSADYAVKADWRELNPETLPDNLREAYEAYKEASRTAATLREAFETAMSTAIAPPPGQRLAFGYRFGKLSIAVIPDDRKPARVNAPATLADFLRSAALTGVRN